MTFNDFNLTLRSTSNYNIINKGSSVFNQFNRFKGDSINAIVWSNIMMSHIPCIICYLWAQDLVWRLGSELTPAAWEWRPDTLREEHLRGPPRETAARTWEERADPAAWETDATLRAPLSRTD